VVESEFFLQLLVRLLTDSSALIVLASAVIGCVGCGHDVRPSTRLRRRAYAVANALRWTISDPHAHGGKASRQPNVSCRGASWPSARLRQQALPPLRPICGRGCDAKCESRRVGVLTGPGRRRRWPADEKARIVAEILVPGGRVSEVARRCQIYSQQVFGWRRTMRQDLPSAPGKTTMPTTPSFVPTMSEALPAATVQRAASAAPGAEVKLADAVVQVSSGMDDAAQLTAVLRAVRASASL
jgi:transposase